MYVHIPLPGTTTDPDKLIDRLGYRRDDALLDDDARLRGLLERLLGQELGADGQAEAALVLGPALVLVGELGGEVFVVLCRFFYYLLAKPVIVQNDRYQCFAGEATDGRWQADECVCEKTKGQERTNLLSALLINNHPAILEVLTRIGLHALLLGEESALVLAFRNAFADPLEMSQLLAPETHRKASSDVVQ